MENVSRKGLTDTKVTFGTPFAETITLSDMPDFKEKQVLFDENERVFRMICEREGIHVGVHRNQQEPLSQILNESRYADLMIIGSDIAFEPSDQKKPSDFLMQVLGGIECPVIIAPDIFEGVDQILFAYDGNAAAAHAIK